MNTAFAEWLKAGLAEYMDELLLEPDFCGCDGCYWDHVINYVIPRVVTAHERGDL